MAEVVDILHKLTFETNEDVLKAVNAEFGTQIKQLNELKKQEAEYNALLEKTAATDIKNRKAIEVLMQRNKKLQDDLLVSVGKQIAANDKLSESIAKTGKSLQGVTMAGSQLLREAPAFTFSLQTGILALSNNIPIFTDALKKAKEEGKSTTEIFKALGSTVTSFGGILTIFIAAATILPTVLKDFNIAGGEANDIAEKSIDLYIEETTKLQVLKDEVLDTTTSQERLHEIRDQIVKQFPAMKDGLAGEENLQGRLAVAIDRATKALEAQAMIRAATELLVEANKKLLTGEIGTWDKFMIGLNTLWQGFPQAFAEGYATGVEKVISERERLLKVIRDTKKEMQASGLDDILKPEDKEAERAAKKAADEAERLRKKLAADKEKEEDALAKDRERRTKEAAENEVRLITDYLEKTLAAGKKDRDDALKIPDSMKAEVGKLEAPTTGGITTAQRDKNRKAAEKAAMDGVKTAINALQQVYEAQLYYADREIALQEERVAKATELAEKGNTEVLEEEKARLNEAQAERDRIAKKQLQLNAILQASNQAVALTEAIGAVVKAASEGDPYTIALRVAAAVAALVAGIASVSSAFQNVNQGYAKGVIDIDGAGTSTSDSIPARLSKGESVMTAAETRQFRPYLQAMRNGTFNQLVNQRTPIFVTSSNDYRTLESKLDGVIEAIGLSSTKVNARVDERGLTIMTQKYSRYDQNRFR